MGMRIRVDQERCIGSANCVETAPAVFDLDEKGKAIVKDQRGAEEELIWEAAEGCPVSAIILEDDEKGEQLYP